MREINPAEAALRAIEVVYGALARAAVAVLSFVWRLQSRLSVTCRLVAGMCGLSILLLGCATLVSGAYVSLCGFDAPLVRALEVSGHLAGGVRLSFACAAAACLCAAATALLLIRRPVVFRVVQVAFASAVATAVLSFVWIVKVPAIFFAADRQSFDAASRNDLWTAAIVCAVPALFWIALLFLALVQKSVRARYGLGAVQWGDDLFGSIKSGGKDRRWRSSVYCAITLFLLVLFLPYLFSLWGWEKAYTLPKGGGEQVLEVVKVKKQKPKKKPKKMTVNPWSPYILERMNIDDVVTLKELEQETMDTYAAQQNVSKGGKGKGSGGWPKGMADSAIRFIRLKYSGGDWDQDMGKGADYNLLIKFHEWTGMKIARETEYREISRLKFFPKKKAPPFVFMTGMRGISISDGEAKILREYCQREGGMLFIDNGGGSFDSAVKNMLRKVFPGLPLVDVPNDDPIYQRPYAFPDGAPAFWHHAGYRAMGIREEGRWLVYYHPGDVNDAWKDDHSGASAEVADQAYKLGVNVMFYAFNQYYRRHYGDD
ncbi:MAG: DUF4159 domain-containing protein [Kiritimatiellae bacterium]|nr:DUF4159 domain-containing protein [Kiritimatiellia bacterium]